MGRRNGTIATKQGLNHLPTNPNPVKPIGFLPIPDVTSSTATPRHILKKKEKTNHYHLTSKTPHSSKKPSNMPPKRSLAPAASPPPRGLISSFYHGIKSPENASVVRSVAVFAVTSYPYPSCVCACCHCGY